MGTFARQAEQKYTILPTTLLNALDCMIRAYLKALTMLMTLAPTTLKYIVVFVVKLVCVCVCVWLYICLCVLVCISLIAVCFVRALLKSSIFILSSLPFEKKSAC